MTLESRPGPLIQHSVFSIMRNILQVDSRLSDLVHRACPLNLGSSAAKNTQTASHDNVARLSTLHG